jgi:hypothetical protein
MKNRATLLLTATTGALWLAFGAPASAQIPTPADYAACNMKAADATSEAPSALPGPVLPDPRPEARGGMPDTGPRNDVEYPGSPSQRVPGPGAIADPRPPTVRGPEAVPTDPTGTVITGVRDPQLEGMAADRATDQAYVAAYRACMRQRGF